MPRLAGVTIVLAALGGMAVPIGAHREQAAQPKVVDELRAWLAGERGPLTVPPSPAERASLAALYGPSHAPIWVDAVGRATPQARQALALFDTAPQDGLDPDRYRPSTGRGAALLPAEGDGPLPTQSARFDVDVSLGVLRYLHDMHQGRVDGRELGYHLSPRTDTLDLVALVREAAVSGRLSEMAAALAPRMRQYTALRDALVVYRRLAAGTPPPDPQSAASLRAFLTAVGDLPANAAAVGDTLPVADLTGALRRFQRRHGLKDDGTLGRETREALQVPMAARVGQIELALERLRWLPRDLRPSALVVNIPMFRLWSWEAEPARKTPPLNMRVIVGRARITPTPVFSADLDMVVFRPYWNVPLSIAINELLPSIRKNPKYLAQHHYEIVRGDGDRPEIVDATPAALEQVAQGTLRIRQRPGPDNALGLIKFVFPNDLSVFMHGTPAPRLFERDRRDLSHGCVRVEDPVALAEWVFNSGDWSRDEILKATTGPDSKSVPVAPPIRVALFYATAAVLPDATIHFAHDLYGHDATLARALWRENPRR